MTPGDEEFYPNVAIQALMRMSKDPSLAVHHGMVVQAVMSILQVARPSWRPLPQQGGASHHACGPSEDPRDESLMKQVKTLSVIVREHLLRPYAAAISDVVDQFWSSRHLGTIFRLVLHIAVGVPGEFRRFVPQLIRRVLTSLNKMQVVDWVTTDSRSNHRGRVLRETEQLRLIICSVQREFERSHRRLSTRSCCCLT
jgi:FKBP12-rapamycin complex-associated protein